MMIKVYRDILFINKKIYVHKEETKIILFYCSCDEKG